MSKRQPQPGERFIPYKQFYGFLIPNSLARSGLCTPVQLLIYGRMSQYSGKDGRCFVSYQKLGDELCLSRYSVTQNVKKLVDKGLIEREQRKGQSTHFHFLWHKVFDEYAVNPDKEVAQVKNNLDKEVAHLPGQGSCPGVDKEVAHEEIQEEIQIEETTTTQPQVNSQAAGDSEEGCSSSFSDFDSKKKNQLSEAQAEYCRLVAECYELKGKVQTTKAAVQNGAKKQVLSGEVEVTDELLAEYREYYNDLLSEKQMLQRAHELGKLTEHIEQMDSTEIERICRKAIAGEDASIPMDGKTVDVHLTELLEILEGPLAEFYYNMQHKVQMERQEQERDRQAQEIREQIQARIKSNGQDPQSIIEDIFFELEEGRFSGNKDIAKQVMSDLCPGEYATAQEKMELYKKAMHYIQTSRFMDPERARKAIEDLENIDRAWATRAQIEYSRVQPF